MGWMRRLLNSGARRAGIERDLTEEVAFHRDQHVADREADGWTAAEARREAQRRIGLTGTWVADGVAENTLPWVTTWLREAGQALRGLRRRPAFLLTVTSTLALGTGVLLAAFTVVEVGILPPAMDHPAGTMPVLVLLGAALVVYLVVCVNVGGLLLVRALSRDHESAVRTALGAGRWAMVRLTLHETSLIIAPGEEAVEIQVARRRPRCRRGS